MQTVCFAAATELAILTGADAIRRRARRLDLTKRRLGNFLYLAVPEYSLGIYSGDSRIKANLSIFDFR